MDTVRQAQVEFRHFCVASDGEEFINHNTVEIAIYTYACMPPAIYVCMYSV